MSCEQFSRQEKHSLGRSFLVYCLSEHFCRVADISLFPLLRYPALLPLFSGQSRLLFLRPRESEIFRKRASTFEGSSTLWIMTIIAQHGFVQWPIDQVVGTSHLPHAAQTVPLRPVWLLDQARIRQEALSYTFRSRDRCKPYRNRACLYGYFQTGNREDPRAAWSSPPDGSSSNAYSRTVSGQSRV